MALVEKYRNKRSRWFYLAATGFLILLGLLFAPGDSAQASPSKQATPQATITATKPTSPTTNPAVPAFVVQQVTQQDLDGNGKPDYTEIRALMNGQQGLIRVYDGGGNMQASSDWQKATDFADDTWVFDLAANGSSRLVIQFSQAGNESTAAMYQDENNDQNVALRIVGSKVTVTEAAVPVVKVIAEGDWFMPDGQLNWNVRFLTDGQGISYFSSYQLFSIWQPSFKRDGQFDTELAFHDDDHDGVPESGSWRVTTATPAASGATRAWLWSNNGHKKPAAPSSFIFWPYLVSGANIQRPAVASAGSVTSPDGLALPEQHTYFDVPPVIGVSWPSGHVAAISFDGYPIEEGYHVNSLRAFTPGKVNYADFENQQAYYDLAENQDGKPELHIRQRYFDQRDIFGFNLPSPLTEIRYSWKEAPSSTFSWDFKLGLAGRQTITSTVNTAGFEYKAVPYDQLPGWVTAQNWDVATFVAREGANFASTEGIYSWPPLEIPVDGDSSYMSRYLSGQNIPVDDRQIFDTLPAGWRGEVAGSLENQADLYLSPVDNKLHLQNADWGFWQIDAQSRLQYDNLEHGQFIDQWTYRNVVTGTQTITTERQLSVAPSYMIYSDGEQTIIRHASASLGGETLQAPTNHDEWQALGAKLSAAALPTVPSDLRSLMTRFPGAEMRISGATAHDYRPTTGEGFRFILSLSQGFTTTGTDLLALSALAPGDYVVTFDGQYTIQAATPISVSGQISVGAIRQLEPDSVDVALQNNGLRDANNAMLKLTAQAPGREPTVVATQTITLLAQQALTTTLHWTPIAATDYKLTAILGDQEVATLAAAPVSAAPQVDSRLLLNVSAAGGSLWFAALAVALIASAGGWIFWRWGRLTRAESGNE